MRILPYTLLLFSCSNEVGTKTDRVERLDRDQMLRDDNLSTAPDDEEKPDGDNEESNSDDRDDDRPGDEQNGDGQDDNSHPDDSEEDDDQDDPVDDRFWPVEGNWDIFELNFSLDDCGLGDLVTGDVDSAATLFLTSGRRFDVNHHFGSDDCELDPTGATFDCRSRVIVDTTARDDYGLDADILLDFFITGNFADEHNMFLQADVEATCAGPSCGLVEFATGTRFPCDMVLDLDASAQ